VAEVPGRLAPEQAGKDIGLHLKVGFALTLLALGVVAGALVVSRYIPVESFKWILPSASLAVLVGRLLAMAGDHFTAMREVMSERRRMLAAQDSAGLSRDAIEGIAGYLDLTWPRVKEEASKRFIHELIEGIRKRYATNGTSKTPG
jgi:hypothetical protein